MNNRVRMTEKERRTMILTSAVKLANKSGLAALTHVAVAKGCVLHTSPRTVEYYFSVAQLRHEVVNDKRANARVKKEAKEAGLT